MVDISLAANLPQLVIFVGAFLGNFIVTMIPYWNERTKFKEYDIAIIFDHKFLATALISGITSIVTVSAAYNSIMAQVDPNSTIFLLLLSSGALGAALNKGLNLILPSPNQEEKVALVQAQKQAVIQEYEKEKTTEKTSDTSTPTAVATTATEPQ